jgi:hypothetical protein
VSHRRVSIAPGEDRLSGGGLGAVPVDVFAALCAQVSIQMSDFGYSCALVLVTSYRLKIPLDSFAR